jgi:hypothetical protein
MAMVGFESVREFVALTPEAKFREIQGDSPRSTR